MSRNTYKNVLAWLSQSSSMCHVPSEVNDKLKVMLARKQSSNSSFVFATGKKKHIKFCQAVDIHR